MSRPFHEVGACIVAAMAVLTSPALAGELDGEVAVDLFTAKSQSSESASGPEEKLQSTELGLRLRAHLSELDDRLTVDLDYHGREPLGGTFENARLHLLYTLDARYEVIESRWTVGLGRFLAPSVVFLPVDGVHTELELANGFRVSAFGGRRGITTSREQLDLGTFLPAVGASVKRADAHSQVEALFTWAGDRVLEEDYEALSMAVRGSAVAGPLMAGGQLSFVQRASYAIGPTWSAVTVDVDTLGLFQGIGWVDWRPDDAVRIGYTLQAQRAAVYRDDVDDPRFFDNRVRASVAPLERGWVRAEVRYRVRPDWNEWRVGGSLEANDLEVPGLYAHGRLAMDAMIGDDPSLDPTVDRLFWSASVGWTRHAFDLQVGASAVERAANPVSSRRVDALEPERSDDLAPFVMEAENIAFLRGFYSARRWFAGVDVERSLNDAEYRLMVQVGVLGATSW